MNQKYNERFYEFAGSRAYASALEMAPLVNHLVQPKSVVDIGCGSGDWLLAFNELGVVDVLGIDDGVGSKAALQASSDRFLRADLRKPIPVNRSFDLAICMEVAEHLPAQDARGLVCSIAALAPVVLFSAAIPQQPGVSHINCRWPEYWVKEFANEGYVVRDCIRWAVWNNPKVSWWYAQNALLFVRESALWEYPRLHEGNEMLAVPLSVVHPRLYETYSDPSKMSLKMAMKKTLQCFAATTAKKFRMPRRSTA
jgi:SAM-dependent methyltransferase